MKRLCILAGVMLLSVSTVQAAAISVANGDFQSAYDLPMAAPFGYVGGSAAGWSKTGSAGTFQPYDLTSLFSSPPAEIGDRIGYIDAGASMFQSLGVVIASDTSYSLSALFGHRLNRGFGGSFGFFAGDASNIISTTAINDPGVGEWGSQTFTLDAAFLSAFVGQQLGIIFLGLTTQVNFDNILVQAFAGEPGGAKVLTNPVPGAVWLFGTALAAGFAGRRKLARAK